MTMPMTRAATTISLIIAQTATTVAMAQPVPPTNPAGPTPVSPPSPDVPQIQPPRPGTGGPQIQPPRPEGPQPVRPPVQPQPVRPPVQPQPVRPPVQPQPVRPPVDPARDYAGTIRCESIRGRWRQCAANTESRVDIVRRLSGTCQRGRSWGFTRSYIWVERGCRADFGYGYARTSNPYPVPQPQPVRGGRPNTGRIIAGVLVAGGLIALLASRQRANAPDGAAASGADSFPAGPPATLDADLSVLPQAARPSVQNCLSDAARQIGVTGGTQLRYDRTTSLEQGNGGWRVRAAVTATYPDGSRALSMYCRATPTTIIQLDFT